MAMLVGAFNPQTMTSLLDLGHDLRDRFLPISLQEYTPHIIALLNAGADIDAQDAEGNTLLHLALETYQAEADQRIVVSGYVVHLLLQRGARTDIPNHAGKTAAQFHGLANFQKVHQTEPALVP